MPVQVEFQALECVPPERTLTLVSQVCLGLKVASRDIYPSVPVNLGRLRFPHQLAILSSRFVRNEAQVWVRDSHHMNSGTVIFVGLDTDRALESPNVNAINHVRAASTRRDDLHPMNLPTPGLVPSTTRGERTVRLVRALPQLEPPKLSLWEWRTRSTTQQCGP